MRYSVSLVKNPRELSEVCSEICVSEIDCRFLKIGRVLDVRWVASSSRTVCAVWKSFAGLCFKIIAVKMSAVMESRQKFAGLLARLASPECL